MADRLPTSDGGPRVNRRAFVAASAAAFLALALDARRSAAHAAPLRRATPGTGHPEPRPGIDASRMPPADKVTAYGPDAVTAFAEARQIPQILDGIRCHCGCADEPGMRSLLTCYEGDAMAFHCHVCQGQARLAYKLHQSGRTLDQIRAAIDARFGG